MCASVTSIFFIKIREVHENVYEFTQMCLLIANRLLTFYIIKKKKKKKKSKKNKFKNKIPKIFL